MLFGNTVEPTRVALSLVPEISIGVDDYATRALTNALGPIADYKITKMDELTPRR